MNPWDIDPSLYVPFWRMLREWYRRRRAEKKAPGGQDAARGGCRA